MQETDTIQVQPSAQEEERDFLGSIMRGDNWIWGIYICLVCISAVEIFSASSRLTYNTASASDPAFSHIRNLFLGAVALLVAQSRSLRSMQAIDKLLYIGGFFLCISAIAFGTVQKGAARSIGGIQPVEVCKLGTIMFLCTMVAARDEAYYKIKFFRKNTKRKRFVFYLLLVGVVAFFVGTQNLSSGIIICLASFGIMFMGKVHGKYLVSTLVVSSIAGMLFLGSLKALYASNHPDGRVNVETIYNEPEASTSSSWIDKLTIRFTTWSERIFGKSDKELWEEDLEGKKSQEIYSRMALANGYPIGQFIGRSKLRDFLPEAYSDYIFAIIFEEWGVIGAALVMLLYLVLFIRCFLLSRRTESLYIRLMMVGIPLIIVIQALIHIGVSTGAMFVTGQPLPLLSRGGSSIFFTSIAFGFLLALSRIIEQEQAERQQLILENLNNEQIENEISD